LFKGVIDQYIQGSIQVFRIWHNSCSKLTSTWIIKIYPRNTSNT